MANTIKKKVFHTQSRKMVYKVYKFMKKESEEGLQCDLGATLLRTSKATGLSIKTVQKVLNELNESESNFLSEIYDINKMVHKSNFNHNNIQKCIHNCYLVEYMLPSFNQLVRKLKDNREFNGSVQSLRTTLKLLGYNQIQIGKNKRILIERNCIRLKRIEYLETISRFRMEGRPIIYTDEFNIDYSSSCSLNDEETDGVNRTRKNRQKAQNIIVLAHAASDAGFVPNALLMFKQALTYTKYCKRMDYESYQKWIRTQVMPNIPENSVLVLGYASYHNKLEDSVLTSTSRKSEMQSWLKQKNITFSTNMHKPQLFRLISSHKDYLKKYKIDCILKENNHTVLRIPPNHLQLNPMRIVWEELKDYNDKYNIYSDANSVEKLIEDKIKSKTSEEWKTVFEKLKSVEEEYKNIDRIIDTLTDEMICLDNVNDSQQQGSSMDDSDIEETYLTNSDDSSSEDNVFCSNETSIYVKGVPDAIDPLRRQ